MKKIITAMTAMSLTLQANDTLNKNLSTQNNKNSQIDLIKLNKDFDLPMSITQLKGENGIYGASGSFGCDVGASGAAFVVGASGTAFCNVITYIDNDLSGNVTEGDVLNHLIQFRNEDSINASGIILDDIIDPNTTLFTNSVNSSQGVINIGNVPGDSAINLTLDTLVPNDFFTLTFSTSVNNINDGEIIDILNQALITTDNLGMFISDDPSTALLHDVTVVQAYGNATIAYSEFASDDFLDHLTPTNIALSGEYQRVLGNVGGLDMEDCFWFNVNTNRILKSIVLEGFQTSGVNEFTEFHLFTGIPPNTNPIGDIVALNFSENDVGNNFINQFDLTLGNYTVCLFEETAGQTYIFKFESTVDEDVFIDGFEN